MSSTSESITVLTGAVLQNGPYGELPLAAHFSYDPFDPFAVSMTLVLDVELKCGHVAQADTTWVFARDILDTALSRVDGSTVGEGDVSATYLANADVLRLNLTSVDGVKHPLYVDASPLYDFMEASLKARPAEEDMSERDVLGQVDAAIEQILGESA